ncbi:MAG: MBL fold metallo-hydrolase [Chromatiales bacterium]|jgi:glyoxylase-like metal-dependent hydrolase (beta-lactamase superfamily II)
MITEERLDFGEVCGIKVRDSIFGHPLMAVIFYHIDDLLIDTGPYCARKVIKNYIEQQNIGSALLTHYHEDHAGNARFLLSKGVTVLGHEKTATKLKNKIRLKPYEHILFGKLEPAKIDLLPNVVSTKHYDLVPVHTPGHSIDHTVYHEPNRGWLFSGDLFLGQKIKYWRKDEDMHSTLQSLDHVLKLDFDSLFCGHNPKLKNPKRYLESKKQHLLDLVDKVNQLSAHGLNKNEILNELIKGKEKRIAKWLTLGDASYKNMIEAAMDVSLDDL